MSRALQRRTLGKLGELAFIAALVALFPTAASAQVGDSRSVPQQSYDLAFEPFADGDYRTAIKAFQAAARDRVRVVEGRWIDSICYHAMAGECYYQMGDLPNALEQYETALSIFLNQSQWMRRVEWPNEIAAIDRPPPAWAVSSRRPVVGDIPARLPCVIGDFFPERAIVQGGVVDPTRMLSVRVGEVARCTMLALSRRRELLGPLCGHTRLSTQLVNALAQRPTRANHWSQAWASALYGAALAGANRSADAEVELNAAVVVADRFDHVLTPLVLMELGKLAAEATNRDAARGLFVEAALAAAVFEQQHTVEESLRRALDLHLAMAPGEPFAPLAGAAAWSDRGGVRPLRASLRLLASENAAFFGDTETASSLLSEAASLVARREMSSGAIGARLAHQSACVQFQQGQVAQGRASLATFAPLGMQGAVRLFQIELIDRMAHAGDLSPRIANEMYKRLLADPRGDEWVGAPRETLAFAAAPLQDSYDRWLESALVRKDVTQAIEIAEQSRRRRFFASTPIAGRILALRWLLEAPAETLNELARAERQEILLRHPGYAALSKQAEAAQAELRALPLTPATPEETKRQAALLEELKKTCAMQEVILHDISLRREAAQFLFPGDLSLDDLRKTMPQDQLLLMFHSTPSRMTAFVASRDDLAWYRVGPTGKIADAVAKLLRDLGNNERNSVLSTKQLADETWRKSAAELARLLFKDAPTRWWEKYAELVIVPDGPLWYAPLECLPVEAAKAKEAKDAESKRPAPLASMLRMRYAPFVSLAIGDVRGHSPSPRTAAMVGKIFPRQDETLAEEAVEGLSAAGEVAVWPANSPPNSLLLATSIDSLVVLADGDDGALTAGGVLAGGAVVDWAALPWRGPERIVAPAFHTAAESGLKRANTGDEVFLTVAGLMSSGARTLLLSRWRTGGQSSLDLTREFVRDLPFAPASEAWRRSLLLFQESELSLDGEPRLNLPSDSAGLRGEHPFLWAGYMLVDTGAEPKR